MEEGAKSKKAPRPGAFLLPKPKPMRRITLLTSYNAGRVFRLHIFQNFSLKRPVFSVLIFLVGRERPF